MDYADELAAIRRDVAATILDEVPNLYDSGSVKPHRIWIDEAGRLHVKVIDWNEMYVKPRGFIGCIVDFLRRTFGAFP